VTAPTIEERLRLLEQDKVVRTLNPLREPVLTPGSWEWLADQRQRRGVAARAAVAAAAEEKDRLARERAESAAAECRVKNAAVIDELRGTIADLKSEIEATVSPLRKRLAEASTSFERLTAEGTARYHLIAELTRTLAQLTADHDAAVRQPGRRRVVELDALILTTRCKLEGEGVRR
jgi:hypothetical protein